NAREVAEVLLRGPCRLALAGLVADETHEAPNSERLPRDVVVPQACGPLAWRQQRRQHPNGRRLAGAIQAEEPEQFALRDLERDAVDRGEAAEAPREAVHLDGPDAGTHRVRLQRRRASAKHRHGPIIAATVMDQRALPICASIAARAFTTCASLSAAVR